MAESEIESELSDDSDVARSMLAWRREVHEEPGDEDYDIIAEAYFSCCLTLHKLYLVEQEIPTAFSRRSDGSVNHFECYDPENDYPSFRTSNASIEEFRQCLDGDGFPKVLSFPREILTHRMDRDPPNYGRESREEREATVRLRISI